MTGMTEADLESEDPAETTGHPDGNTRLYTLLRTVAYKEQIAEALGMQDPDAQDEEFWVDQRRTAKSRFYLLCLERLGWDLGTYRENLDSGQAHAVADEAESLLADGALRYKDVRAWWLNRGQFEYSMAVERRREVERQKTSALRVLFILKAGGAKYLAYTPDVSSARLVDTVAEAYQFRVRSSQELERAYLEKMAVHFDSLKNRFEATQVKVLPGPKT